MTPPTDIVSFTIPGNPPEEFTFYFRDGASPAAFHLITQLETKLSTWRFDPNASRAQQVETAKDFGAALFPDEARTQQNMRVILSGPHDRINWYLDSSWPRLIAIAADWLTRAEHAIKASEREESDRMARVKARIAEAE
jgi:hypothetical protein